MLSITLFPASFIVSYLSDQGSTADMTIHSKAKGDLPWELARASVLAVDDTASGAFLTALCNCRVGKLLFHDVSRFRLRQERQKTKRRD